MRSPRFVCIDGCVSTWHRISGDGTETGCGIRITTSDRREHSLRRLGTGERYCTLDECQPNPTLGR